MDDLERLANLLRQKTQIDAEISQIIGRPAHIGHLGEFIASRVFQITLAPSATEKGFDGHFASGPLEGASVNIKWYARQEGVLDLDLSGLSDYYLVLAGPRGALPKGDPRPWLIRSVHLFDARRLAGNLSGRGIKLGIATSVTKAEWERAEVYPNSRNTSLPLTEDQRKMLALFG